MKISGIYKIINKINGKYYVGSSDDIQRRWKKHILDLNNNKHHSIYLQRAWNKYGEKTFSFIIVEYMSNISELLEREQYYLNDCKNNIITNYNVSYDSFSPMAGRRHSFKTLQKMSISQSGKNNPMYGKIGANKGKIFSLITRMKMSKNNSKYWKGKSFSEKTKRKMSLSHLGEKNARYGKHHTKEAKKKLSLIHRDKTIYHLKNINTNEIFEGTTYNFSQKFNFIPNSVRKLVLGKMKILKKWCVYTIFQLTRLNADKSFPPA